MIRVPGSLNSRNSSEIKIIQGWDGKRPAINWLLRDFRRYLVQDRFEEERDIRHRNSFLSKKRTDNKRAGQTILWIDTLLQTPIRDYRKNTIWLILAPYFINIRKEPYDKAYMIIRDWLVRCSAIEKLNFNPDYKIKSNLDSASKVGYLPISFNNLKLQNRQLYNLILNK